MARIEQKTDKAIRASTKSVSRLDGALRSVAMTARSFAGAFGAGFLVGGLSGLVTAAQQAVSSVADLADAANRAGVSAEKLQVLRFALEQNGASAADADVALSRLTKTIGEAATNASGPAADVFKALGVSIRDASGAIRGTDAVFNDVVDQLSRVESQAQVAAVAAKLFGREAGSALAPTLQQGSAALADFEADLRSAGSLMSNELVSKADELDDRFKRLQNTIGSAFKIAAVEVADAVADIIGEMNRLAASIPKKIDAAKIGADMGRRIGDPAGARIGQAFDAVGAQQDIALRNALIRKRAGPALSPILETGGGGGRTPKKTDADRIAEAFARDDARERMRSFQEDLDRISEKIDSARDTAQGFAETFVGGMRAGEGVLGSLSSALDQIAGKLSDLALNNAFDALFGKRGGAGGGALGGLFGGLSRLPPKFGGLFAEGGTLGAGKWGIAGERGLEAIRGPATIEPLRKGGFGGQQEVMVRTSVHVEPSPFLITSARQQAEAVTTRNNRAVPGIIADRQQRYG